jgi:hypothetical protein
MKRLILLFLVLGNTLPAANVYIDSSLVTLIGSGPDSTTFNAKMRASNTGPDMTLAPSSATTAGGTQYISYNIANSAGVSSRTFDFELKHLVGKGFVFSTTDNVATPVTRVLAYGSGFTQGSGSLFDLPNASATTLVTQDDLLNFGSPLTPTGPSGLPSFNSLKIEARTSAADFAFIRLSNFVFSGAVIADGALDSSFPASSSGEFADGDFDNSAANIGADALNGVSPTGTGQWFQRIVSDSAMNGYDWQLTGSLQLSKSFTTSDEGVRFAIYGEQVNFSVVPEPSSSLLVLLAGALLSARRRRCFWSSF